LFFLLAIGLWPAAAVAYRGSLHLPLPTYPVAFAATAAVIAVGLSLLFKLQGLVRKGCAVLAVGLGLGAFCGFAAAYSFQETCAQVGGLPQGTYAFEVVEDAREGSFGNRCLARLCSGEGAGALVSLSFSEKAAAAKDMGFGQLVFASVRINAPGKERQQDFWDKGIAATATASHFEKYRRDDLFGMVIAVRERALEALEGEEGRGAMLLRAMLFGDRRGMNKDGFSDEVRATGLAHLIAVSGAHLVVVTSTLGLILRTLRVPRRAVALVQLFFIIAYLIATGLSMSALRAACMAVIGISSVFAARRSSSLNALGLAVLAMVAASPAGSLSPSFSLSVLATLGIVVLAPLFCHWVHALLPRLPKVLTEGMALGFAANVLAVPYAASLFSQASLVSSLMNLLAAPWFSLMCAFGFPLIGLRALVPGALTVFGDPLLLFADAFAEFVSWGARLPFASVPVSIEPSLALTLGFSCLVLLWVVWPRPSHKKLAVLAGAHLGLACLLLLVAPLFVGDRIIMLNIGQGDAFVVRSQGATVLIDTGNHEKELRRGLGRQGIYRLDAIFITHADDDHCGSLESLRGIVAVDRVCVAKPLLDCPCSSCQGLLGKARRLVGDGGIEGLEVGDRIRVGAFDLEVVWPEGFKEKGGNADSLILLLRAPAQSTSPALPLNAREDAPNLPSEANADDKANWKALFCGDAEWRELDALIGKGRLNDIDILKVGHHGSRASVNDALLEALKPRIALISVGAYNRYGHPTQEAVEALEKAGVEVFRSDEEGDVVCEFSLEKVSVSALG
jgi:competence protein ComEC